MRLITKTTLLYLATALLVFGIGGIVTLSQVRKIVQTETDYALRSNLRMIAESLGEGKPMEDLENRKVRIAELPDTSLAGGPLVFSDTLVLVPRLQKMEPFRKLTAIRTVNSKAYRFEIIDVFIESDDIFNGVVNLMSRLFLFLSAALILFGFLISRGLLRPFRGTLDAIQQFDLKKNEQLNLPPTTTREFRQLNGFILDMTARVRQEYQSLKEFSENASHEMQTPIAIARGKLELLLESEDLSENQSELIQSAQDALARLSRMGKALTLLTRIENHEFPEKAPIDFSAVVEENVKNFQELTQLKGLSLETAIQAGVGVSIDRNLADILVTNLLKNAIQHNVDQGHIRVVLDMDHFLVSNSGPTLNIPPQELFKRFRKSNQSSSSLGLGLAIVKKICEVSELEVEYLYQNGEHQMRVSWPV